MKVGGVMNTNSVIGGTMEHGALYIRTEGSESDAMYMECYPKRLGDWAYKKDRKLLESLEIV